ncbi:MAG: DNA repair protein RadA/Sms [Myxococcota bacterium]|jgi:DNA repair protein RadA/Sms
MTESVAVKSVASKLGGTVKPVRLADVDTSAGELRVRTGLNELDTVLGGGLVAGSLVLIGGDPGVGKSTLLLMALDRFASKGVDALYVSGEESVRQVHLRAGRLGVTSQNLLLLSETRWDVIEQACRSSKPRVVVIDSIQTMSASEVSSIPGSVSQVREVAHRAMIFAKETGIAVFLVGHVTKSGEIAGPKVLEHFVDTVLYFEGDGRSSLRVLRSVKNRFGPAGELGMFEMAEEGLVEVPDASARLLEERVRNAPGTSVVATLEGSRPLLAEVQALVGRSTPATPARTCVGVDRGRVLMLAAVAEKAGLSLHDRDIFVNAAGGVRLHEPAADLAIVMAIASSLVEVALDPDTLFLGELGLVGEVRSIPHPTQRLKEAARHGFQRALVPPSAMRDAPPGIKCIPVKTLREALGHLGE